MQFKTIFAEYYTKYRGDSDIPAVTDPEWAIAVRFGNTALRRLQHVDGEVWEWLWTDTATEGATLTYTTTSAAPVITTYTCPDNMDRPGGLIRFTDPKSGASTIIDVVPASDAQLHRNSGGYAYFTGDSQNGFTLNLAMSGDSYVGYLIDFPYYKQLTYFNEAAGQNGGVAEDGTTVTECPDANFIINAMLADRFISTRNYTSYGIAHQASELALQGMQIKNRIGVDGHPWNSMDASPTTFGSSGFGGF